MISSLPIITVIGQNANTATYIRESLRNHDFIVKTATSGAEGLALVKHTDPNLILLDMQLPDISGETICREIKTAQPHIPVILLSAKNSTQEKIRGFEIGADDYIVKPFATEELVARVRARLRNYQQEENQSLKIADLTLDPNRITVTRGGKPIRLTPNEFRLLYYLMSNRGIVLTREMILNRIWTYVPNVETRVVDVYMGYLRKKIDKNHKRKLLHSVRGFGYTLKE